MKKAGRPTLSKKLKKVNHGFTALPKLGLRLKKIKGNKSPFIEAILMSVPDSLIQKYNADPEKFVSEAQMGGLDLSGPHKHL